MTDPTNARRVIAEALGINRGPYTSEVMISPHTRVVYDLSTIDGYAALWRDKLPGWVWERRRTMNLRCEWRTEWFATNLDNHIVVTVPDTGDELADRERLTASVCEVMKGAK